MRTTDPGDAARIELLLAEAPESRKAATFGINGVYKKGVVPVSSPPRVTFRGGLFNLKLGNYRLLRDL